MIKKLEDKAFDRERGITKNFISTVFELPPEVLDKINEIIEEVNKLKKEKK